MAEHPEGTFEAEILDHGFGAAKTGTDQFVVKFKTEHGHLNGYFPLTDSAAEYTTMKIRSMGYMGNDFAELEDGTALKGNKCQIVVEKDPKYGLKVTQVNEIGYVPGVKRDEKVAKSARKFNSYLRANPPKDPDVPF